jgi:DNA ligase (NAD+)
MKSNSRTKILKELLELDGIGETQINSIDNFFSNVTNTQITLNLIKELNIFEFKTISKKGVFLNKKIMFTGGFRNMSRSEAKSIAESKGGKVLGSISKKLDYLVVGELKPTKKKVDKAKDMKIRIISEQEWNKILNS